MDPKTYEQFKAMGEQLKAKREAEAAAQKKPAAPAPAAAARRTTAPKPEAKTVAPPASVAAKPKQTKPSAVPVVTPPPVDATAKSKFDADLRQDLKLEDLYRETRDAPSLTSSLREIGSKLNIGPQRYKELAAVQGVDLEDLDRRARSGMPFESYRKAKEGVIGFVPVEQRSSMFEEVAKDYAAAEKGEIRTDKRIDTAPASEKPATIKGFTEGYIVGGTTPEETVEVVKPGEHYYDVARAYLEAVDKNPEVVKLVNLYGNSLGSGATAHYINERAQMLMRDKGITPTSPDADRQAALARRQAMYEVVARKTVGQWTPGIFVKDVQVTDDAKATDNPFAALGPNIELIGFNSKGDAVFRQESPAGTLLRALDFIGVVPIPGKKIIPVPIPGQSMVSGWLTKGDDEGWWEAASRGVSSGANLVEVALDKTKDSSLPVKAVAAGAAFLPSIFYPDVTSAAGTLAESGKALRTMHLNKKLAKEADPLLKSIAAAYNAKDIKTAEAADKALAANKALGRVRGHGVVDAYLRDAAAFIQAQAALDPSIKSTVPDLFDNLVTKLRTDNPKLAEFIYENAVTGAPHLHFSVGMKEAAAMDKEGGALTTFLSFLNAGDYTRRRERIQAARDAFAASMPRTAEEAFNRVFDDTLKAVRSKANDAVIMGVSKDEVARDERLLELMNQYKADLLADPDNWLKDESQFKQALLDDPLTGGPENSTWRSEVYSTVTPGLIRRAKQLKANSYDEILRKDLQVFDDALASIDANIKSHAMAAEALRRRLGEEANINITPVDILDHIKDVDTERLSPMAQSTFITIVRQFDPDQMNRADTYRVFQILDAVMRGFAERNGQPVEEVWRSILFKVEKGEVKLPGLPPAVADSPKAKKVAAEVLATAPAPAQGKATPGTVVEAAVPQTAEVDAAVTATAKQPAPVKKLHENTTEVLADLKVPASAENVSKVLTVAQNLGPGATWPSRIPFVPNETTAAVRDALVSRSEWVKLENGKIVKAKEVSPAPEKAVEKRVESLKAQTPAPKVGAPAAARPLAEDIKAAKNVPGTLKTPEVAKQLEAALEATPYGAKFEFPASMGADARLYLPTVLTDRGDLWFEEGKGYLRTVGGVQPSTTPEDLRAELETVRDMQKTRPENAQLSRRATLIEDAIKRLEEAPALELEEGAFEAPKAVEPPRQTVGPADGWLNQNVQLARSQADRAGLTSEIEDLFSEGLTVDQVKTRLGDRIKFVPLEEKSGWVGSVRNSLGIPSRMTEEGQAEFMEWLSSYQARKAKAAEEVEAAPVEAVAEAPAPAAAPVVEAPAKAAKATRGKKAAAAPVVEAAPAPAVEPIVEAAPVAAKVEPAPAPAVEATPAPAAAPAPVAVPVAPPAATLENLGNRDIWTSVRSTTRKLTGAYAGQPPTLETTVAGVKFRISAVPTDKGNVYKIMARAGDELESLGATKGYASLEDALRALTPTASGPAPLRAEIDKLMRGGVQEAGITAKAVKQAAKEKELTPVQQLSRAFNEAFDYDIKGSVTTSKLVKSAYAAGERAAETGKTYEQAFAQYEDLVRAIAKDDAKAATVIEKLRGEFESGLRRGQLLAAPTEAAVPAVSVEQKLAKAKEELGKITRVQNTPDGSQIYGRVEGDMFVPMYELGPSQQRNAAEALYLQINEGRTAVDAPVALAGSGAREVNMQPILGRLEKMADEGDLYQIGTRVVKGKEQPIAKGKISFPSPEEAAELRASNPPVAVITLFRNAADPTTILHEGAHFIRKMGLEAADMDIVTRWVRSKGINVTNNFGDFVGDAAEVSKAEELFAQAFEAYVAKGQSPTPTLASAFEKLKVVFGKIYRTLVKSPLGMEIDDDVKEVFSRLFSKVPDKAPETTFDMLLRHTFNNKGLDQKGGLTVLAREAERRGMPGKSVDDLAKMLASAAKTHGSDWQSQVVLDFPAPVFGKTKWTGADVLELDRRVLSKRNDLALAPLKQALFGAPEETKATEQIFTMVEGREDDSTPGAITRGIARGMAHTIIGGDIVGEQKMRNLLPEVRRDLNTAAVIIENGTGDTIEVLNDTIRTGNPDFMYRFLAGESGMTYSSGRRVISSGQEFIAGFMDLFRNAGAALTSEERALLQDFAAAINAKANPMNPTAPQNRSEAIARLIDVKFDDIKDTSIKAARQERANRMRDAIVKFRDLRGSGDSKVGSQLATAIKSATKEGAEPNINEFRLTETLLYLAGITPRDGKFFVQVDKAYTKEGMRTAAQTLLEESRAIYGDKGELLSRRLSILVGAYGSSARAKAELAGLGMVLTKEQAEAYKNWTLCRAVTPEMRVQLEGIMRKFGANTEFEADTILGVDVYLPKQARERVAEALGRAQFNEQRLTKVGDLYQMAFSFTKKRMTRGNFILRMRYFMVNTIDHFFQMSLIVGYVPAFQSASRLALQNVMASPLGQAFETVVRTGARLSGGKIDRAIVEKFRDQLSLGGDAVAHQLQEWMGSAKYRIEVNHILEGRDMPIILGGHVTTGKRLREIMVAEGILESYNTRRLGNIIRQEGMAYMREADGIMQAGIDDGTLAGNASSAWAKFKEVVSDITLNAVDDIGDAWAERERIGAAVTLIEHGYEPRMACRLTVDALYDYAQSMTKIDRSLLVGLIFPFWAFQKNANQQFINVLATPYGAYRMMVMKRARDRSTELLTELYYNAVGGELGLDVDSMPQDMQDMYYAVMTEAHEVYGDEIPEDAKLALRMLLTGRSQEIVDGKYYELDSRVLATLRSKGVVGAGSVGMSEYMLARPNRSALPSYLRERPGVLLAQRRNALVRAYSGLTDKYDEQFFLMMPPASFEDAFKHTASVMASALLAGGYTATMVPGVAKALNLSEKGIEGTELLQAVKPVFDLERSPVAGPIIGMYAERGYPQRVHPYMAYLLQSTMDLPIMQMPAQYDVFDNENLIVEMEGSGPDGLPKNIVDILGEDKVRTIQELNSKDIDPNDLKTVRDMRYYLPPGGYSIAFENTLGELNKALFQYSRSPAEKTEALGEILFALRNLTGLEVSEVSAAKTARQEEPVFYTKSRKPF